MNLSLSEDKDAAPGAASSKSTDASTNATAAFSYQVSDAVRIFYGNSHGYTPLVDICSLLSPSFALLDIAATRMLTK